MPELPEVETIRLTLSQKILGLKIKQVEVLSLKSFIGDTKEVSNKKVISIIRRGKVLGVNVISSEARNPSRMSKILDRGRDSNKLRDSSPSAQNDKGRTLLFHFKMSGQLIYKGFIGGHPTHNMLGQMPNSHTRVIFEFSDKSRMYFNDQRKFGWIKVVKTTELENINYGLALKMGPEPLVEGFTWKVLKENLLKHKKMPIKVAIMDPQVVVGVGNIYANEACFLSKIDPRSLVSNLKDQDMKKLHQAIIEALKKGIKYGGSTKTHFVDADGKKGLFLDYAYVYNQDKKPCKVCGTIIQKFKLGGRGTFFCANCQK